MENIVVFLLVAEAAQQTATDARYLRRIQEKVLFLGHLDGHGHELAQETAAAADHAATAHSPEHLRFVAHPDLPQLNAGVVLAHQVLDQFPEIDTGGRRKIENQLAAVEKYLHVHELHIKLALADARLAEAVGVVSEGVVFLDGHKVLVRHLA